MSELESLLSRANQLASKVDFWNSAVLWALLVTALAAAAIVFSQRLAFVRARQLSDVQESIDKIKEANATDRADKLDQANRALSTDLEKEIGKVAGLEKDASNAKAAQQKVELELTKQQEIAEQLKAQNLATEQRLEDERKTLASRVLPSILNKSDKHIDRLRPYRGIQVILEYIPDEEARRAAGSISIVIQQVGWKVIKSTQQSGLSDGVTIESHVEITDPDTSEERIIQSSETEKCRSAALAFRDLLVSSGWLSVDAWLAAAPTERLPPNTIKIEIGFKPSPYFEPAEVTQARERRRAMEDLQEKRLMFRESTPPK